MPEYVVEFVQGEPRDWQSEKGGPMLSYKLKLRGRDEVVELSQKKDTPPPAAGQQIDGEIVPSGNQYPDKLKKTYSGGNFGGGQNGKDWEASGRAQGRAHAQEMALRYCALKGQADVNWGDLLKLMDAFYDDAQAALAKDYRK